MESPIEPFMADYVSLIYNFLILPLFIYQFIIPFKQPYMTNYTEDVWWAQLASILY